jgi:beta-lactamase regulating signal transducer with metallopeptidase domain
MLQFLTHSGWVERVGWVLVHSLWQFAILAIMAIVARRAFHRRSAALRYRTLLAAMLVLVALPVVTWLWIEPAEAPVAVVETQPVEQLAKAPPTRADATPVELTGQPMDQPPAAPNQLQLRPRGYAWVLSLVQRRVHPWLPAIVLLWLAGVFVAAFRPLWGWHVARRLKTVGVARAPDAIHAVLERTARRLRLDRAVELLQSALVQSPAVVGYFRPVILLPLCVVSGLPEAQLELILAHELAHIRRHDYLVNVFQTLVETLFFYHPAVWWLSAQVRNERENCCDDMAMAIAGSRADYGRALLAIAEMRAAPNALSLGARGGSLVARIRRIAGCEPVPRVVGGGSILGVVLVSIAMVGSGLWGAAPTAEKLEATSHTEAANAAVASPPAATVPGKSLAAPAASREAKEPGAEAVAMRIHVVGSDGRPVAGARVVAKVIALNQRNSFLREYVCNADGQVVLDLPYDVRVLLLELSHDGYLKLVTDWFWEQSFSAAQRLPRRLAIQLTKVNPGQVQALAELQKLGGGCAVDLRQSDQRRRVGVGLAGEQIDAAALALVHRLPDPDELSIFSPKLTDAGLAALESLHSLKALTLDYEELTDAGLAHLEGLRGLRELHLTSPHVTDAGLLHLQPLHALVELTLACAVTEAGLKHFAPLKELRKLIVYRLPANPATKKVVEALGQPTRLDFVECPLQDVCKYLSDYHGIKVQIGEAAVKSGKVKDVTCLMKDVPLSAALDKMLSPMGLGWVVERGAVVITTSDIVAKTHQEIDKLRQALPKVEQFIVALPEPSPPATTTPPTGGTNGKTGTSDPPPAAKIDEVFINGKPGRVILAPAIVVAASPQAVPMKSDQPLRYAKAALRVAEYTLEKNEEANRKVPGSVPAAEVRRLESARDAAAVEVQNCEKRINARPRSAPAPKALPSATPGKASTTAAAALRGATAEFGRR